MERTYIRGNKEHWKDVYLDELHRRGLKSEIYKEKIRLYWGVSPPGGG